METSKYKIVLTGANGFTGRFVCNELIRRKIQFAVILRPDKKYNWIIKRNIKIIYSDLNDITTLRESLKGFNCIINISSLAFINVGNLIKLCEELEIKRGVFISTTAIFTNLNAKSKKIRKLAEKYIAESDLNWTILRPTMIYGTPNDRNIIKLIRWINNLPLLPIFGNGNSFQQPIYVNDVACAICSVIYNKKTFKKSYNISGLKPLTYNNIVEIISKSLNKKILKIHLPHKLIYFILRFFEFFKFNISIKSEQILRLNEDKVFSYQRAKEDFSFSPLSFEEGIKKELTLFNKLS